jgi:hypothetical protein
MPIASSSLIVAATSAISRLRFQAASTHRTVVQDVLPAFCLRASVSIRNLVATKSG